MGLFERLRGGTPKRTPTPEAPAHRKGRPRPSWARDGRAWRAWPGLTTCVRGEQHHTDGFRAAVGRRRELGYLEPVDVVLVRDPGNEYDANAIRAELDGHLVGHVAREVAAELAPVMDDAGVGRALVAGVVRGGRSESSPGGASDYSLHLWLGRVIEPEGLSLTSSEALPSSWPPAPWEGRGFCPQCGLFKSIEEVEPGVLVCGRCDHQWADPS